MKIGWILVIVAVAFGAAWGYAKFELANRVDDFRMGVRDLNFARRGGHLMDEAEVESAIEQTAAQHQVQVVAASVSMEPLTDENRDQADAVTRMVDQRAGEAFDDATSDAHVEGTVLEIALDVRSKKWLWSTSEHIDDRRVLGRQLVIDR